MRASDILVHETSAVAQRSSELAHAFREHRTVLYSIARRYAGDDAATDVVQEVFTRAWKNQDGFDETRGTIRQYLCMLTRGVAIDHVRSAAARLSRDDRHGRHIESEVGDTAQMLINHETTTAVISALGRLAPIEREAIMSAFYDGLTYREVAVRLGIAEGTAKSRIRIGLRKLRAELGAAPSLSNEM